MWFHSLRQVVVIVECVVWLAATLVSADNTVQPGTERSKRQGGVIEGHAAGRTDQAIVLDPLPERTTVVRHIAGAGPKRVLAGETPLGTLIYSNTNTGDGRLFRPRANEPHVDDLYTTAVGGGALTAYVLRVGGGVEGGGGTFSCRVELYDDCPLRGGELIPGTDFLFEGLADDFDILHDLVVDVSDQPIPIPPVVWLQTRLDTESAGFVGGWWPEVGYTTDKGTDLLLGCGFAFPGWPGFPSPQFRAQVYATGDTEQHHLGYLALNRYRSNAFASNIDSRARVADQIVLVPDECEVSAVELGVRGTSGPFELSIDLRLEPADGPIPGTSFQFFGLGNGELELAHHVFEPGVVLPQEFWITWKADQPDVAVVGKATPEIGSSDDEYMYEFSSGHWRIGVDHRSDAHLAVYCRGDAATGACCRDETLWNPLECLDGVQQVYGRRCRWAAGETCADLPFDPPCGANACCTPYNVCEDLEQEHCEAIGGTWTARTFCDANDFRERDKCDHFFLAYDASPSPITSQPDIVANYHDFQLGVELCELRTLEVGMKGSFDPFEMHFDLSIPDEEGSLIPDAELVAEGIGFNITQNADFRFGRGLFLPRNLRLNWWADPPGATIRVAESPVLGTTEGQAWDIAMTCYGDPPYHVVWLDPPTGVVDARQPHSRTNPAEKRGIWLVTVAADVDALDETRWSICETQTDGDPLRIRKIDDNGNGTYRLILSRKITAGGTTTLTFSSDGRTSTGVFKSHPGNVNGDAIVSVADILSFIDCCTNRICTPAWGQYSCDINHASGFQGMEPEDLRTLFAILTGNQSFDSWMASARPPESCDEN